MPPRKTLTPFFALTVAFFASTGHATDASNTCNTMNMGFSPQYAACLDSAKGHVTAADACMTKELSYQDGRLNKTYKELLQNLQPDAREPMIEAERSWVQFRAKESAFESNMYGNNQPGNAQQLENDLKRVAARVNQLEDYLKLAKLL